MREVHGPGLPGANASDRRGIFSYLSAMKGASARRPDPFDGWKTNGDHSAEMNRKIKTSSQPILIPVVPEPEKDLNSSHENREGVFRNQIGI